MLKLSGEALGSSESIYDKNTLQNITDQVKELIDNGIQVSIVVGGGNIFRGAVSDKLGLGQDTAPADYMGMMATSINALGLKTYFNENGLEAEMLNSLQFEKIADKVTPELAKKELENKVVIFGGGTGAPYLSTDTAAAMRALDIEADVILMAKNGVDGVYTADPKTNVDAEFISEITFDEIIERDLKVVDHEAMKMLKGQNIDILLFNMNIPNNIVNLFKNPDTKKTIIKN